MGKPEPPKPLEGDALDEWGRIVADMDAAHTLSPVDSHVLFQYCHVFAETEALKVDCEVARGSVQMLEENLHGLKGPDLVACFQEIAKLRHDIRGYARDIRQNRLAMRVYLVELGMTPAARSRVKVLAVKDADTLSPLAALQRQARQIRAVK